MHTKSAATKKLVANIKEIFTGDYGTITVYPINRERDCNGK